MWLPWRRLGEVRIDVKIPHSRMTNTCPETLVMCCEMYATSHTRTFLPFGEGIRFLRNV